jgi:hypothetical protein
MMPVQACSICNGAIVGFGNDAQPINGGRFLVALSPPWGVARPHDPNPRRLPSRSSSEAPISAAAGPKPEITHRRAAL